MPVLAAVFDIVELILHVRRKRHVHNVRKILAEYVRHRKRDFRRINVFALFFGVLSL